MADVDEDAIPRQGVEAGETDLSDETQDFRFLASVSKEDAKIPKRGEKDFEPHATALQSDTLAASRAAMHDALSFQRVHPPKKAEVAIYHRQTNMAYLDTPRSTLFKSMGKVYSGKDELPAGVEPSPNRLWLLPEEILYLLERGTVDCRWPAMDPGDGDSDLPMSLQGAYAAFIGLSANDDDALTFERYSVYSGLKRMGYAVHRADGWSLQPQQISQECYPPSPGTWQKLGLTTQWLRSYMYVRAKPSVKSQACGPLASQKCYREYADIYRSLAMIPWYDPTKQQRKDRTLPDLGLRTIYHVWKPSNTSYKKSNPGPPDFRIAVLNARDTTMPTLAQLDTLFATQPYQPPYENAQLYAKLRHGYKNVILAVVDEGVTSYLRLCDAAFGKEHLYNRSGPAFKGKRGGGKGKQGKK